MEAGGWKKEIEMVFVCWRLQYIAMDPSKWNDEGDRVWVMMRLRLQQCALWMESHGLRASALRCRRRTDELNLSFTPRSDLGCAALRRTPCALDSTRGTQPTERGRKHLFVGHRLISSSLPSLFVCSLA
jgi:hypothetical protein